MDSSTNKNVVKSLFYLTTSVSHLDADLVGLGRGYLNLFDHQRFVRFPGHCRLALDNLEGRNTCMKSHRVLQPVHEAALS